MPIFEYICNNCGHHQERLEFRKEISENHICPDCGENMDRMISRCSFKLEYNPKKDICDWSGNTSRYWDAVKNARAEGKNVKPAIDGDKY